MTGKRFNDASDVVRMLAILAARASLGLGLALVLGMMGLVVAWGLFIFSSSSDRDIFMIMTLAGGGIGAGIGPSIAWMKLDRHNRSALLLTLALCVAGAVIGGLLGYQYGANREIDCCAEPQTTPFLFTAFGAAIGANVIMYAANTVTAAARMIRSGRKPVADRP